jgi:hypothetical protein
VRYGFEYHMEISALVAAVESAAPRTPDGPAVRPLPLIRFVGERGLKYELYATIIGSTRVFGAMPMFSVGGGTTWELAVLHITVLMPVIIATKNETFKKAICFFEICAQGAMVIDVRIESIDGIIKRL